jgi:hypothetical protein
MEIARYVNGIANDPAIHGESFTTAIFFLEETRYFFLIAAESLSEFEKSVRKLVSLVKEGLAISASAVKVKMNEPTAHKCTKVRRLPKERRPEPVSGGKIFQVAVATEAGYTHFTPGPNLAQ